jgi:hypothetical protein
MSFLFLLVYLLFVCIRPHEYISYLIYIPILPILLVASFASWLFFGRKEFNAPQYGLIIIFMMIMAISVAANGWLGGGIKVINDFYPTVILFFILSNTIDSPQKMRWIFALFITASAITALHGVGQAEAGIGWTGITTIGGRIRYIGIFEDPNDLGLLFLISLPMLGYCIAQSRWLMVKMVLIGTLGLILYAIYLTNSRGTVLGLVAMVFVWLYRKHGIWKACLMCLILSPMAVLAPSRMNELKVDEESAFGRWDAWYSGFQMLKSNPLFGVGKGNFTEHHELTAHNSFVLVFSETGLIGYFVWFCFIYLSFYMLYVIVSEENLFNIKNNSYSKNTYNDMVDIGNAIYLCFIGFFFSVFFLSRSYNILLYVLCALSVTLYKMIIRIYPNVKRITFFDNIFYLSFFTIVSIISMYLIMKTLINII